MALRLILPISIVVAIKLWKCGRTRKWTLACCLYRVVWKVKRIFWILYILYVLVKIMILCWYLCVCTCVFAGLQNNTCDTMCTRYGCWGPGPTMCFACQDYSRTGSCVDSCNLLEGWGRIPCLFPIYTIKGTWFCKAEAVKKSEINFLYTWQRKLLATQAISWTWVLYEMQFCMEWNSKIRQKTCRQEYM